VAPDESTIAFIGVDKSPGFDESGEPFVLASTIYIARASDHFRPAKVPLSNVRVADAKRDWQAFRYPSVSPNGSLVFFFAQTSIATGGTIFAYDLGKARLGELGQAINWCTVWKGPSSGSILVWERRYTGGVDREPYDYLCFIRAPGRKDTPAACSEFSVSLPLHGPACTNSPQ
jgi:hypothetical protein